MSTWRTISSVRAPLSQPFSAADPPIKAGIAVGDSIDTIDGTPVASADDLATAVARLRPGQKVELSLMRSDGSTSTKTVTLGELPAS